MAFAWDEQVVRTILALACLLVATLAVMRVGRIGMSGDLVVSALAKPEPPWHCLHVGDVTDLHCCRCGVGWSLDYWLATPSARMGCEGKADG